jgi:hypothetical protein
MQIQTMPTHSTVDGDSDARSLGLFSKPGTLPVAGLSSTDYDEMDFSYIKSKPAWFTTFTYTTSNVVDDVLSTWAVEPYALRSDNSALGGTAESFTPVAFLASNFQYWRGSIIFRIKVVKTSFHSGRIQIAFFPTDDRVYTGSAEYVNRMIVDIREHNEIELIVPYISKTPWMKFKEDIGIVRVSVVDPLVAPTTVSPSISMVVEAYGGKDFEVAVPQRAQQTPCVFAPQSIVPGQITDNLLSANIGSSKVNANPIVMTSTTIGEKITSLRAFLKRFSPISRVAGTVANNAHNTTAISVIPDAILALGGIIDPTVPILSTADSLSVWASCYSMMSGGIRFRNIIDLGVVDSSPGRLHSAIASLYHPSLEINNLYMLADLAELEIDANFNKVYNQLEKDNSLTIELPQYTQALSRSVGDCIIFQQSGGQTYDGYTATGAVTGGHIQFGIPVGYTITPQRGYSVHNVSRSGADDLQLYGFISVPPMFTLATEDHTGSY